MLDLRDSPRPRYGVRAAACLAALALGALAPDLVAEPPGPLTLDRASNRERGAGAFLHEATLEGRPLHTGFGQAEARFGSAVAASGDTLVVGSRLEDYDNASDGGAVYVYTRSGGTWSLQQRLVPLDPTSFLLFGVSVAIDGDTVIIGAEGDDSAASGAGAAYVFVRSGTTWSQQQKLVAPDAALGDEFGYGVSISGDTAVVSAEFANTSAGFDAGAAWVFVRSGTVWTLQQKLVASDGSASDFFVNVAVSGDIIVVGADSDDTVGGADAGSAYVFVRSGTVWSEQQKLTAFDGGAFHSFGWSVAVLGETVVIGAPFAGSASSGAGAAYVFVRSETTWSLQQRLSASDQASADHLGWNVSISGETVLAVADHDDTPSGVNTGSVYVFVRSEATWSQQQRLVASDATAGDQLSRAAVSGNTVVAGAGGAELGPAANAGEAYAFVRSGTTWSEQQVLAPPVPTGLDRFGISVWVSGDTALVGTSAEDTAAGADAGAAYVFVRSGGTWVEQQRLEAADAATGAFFGVSVVLFGDTAIVGASQATASGVPFAGAAYVFVRSGGTWTQQQKLEAADASTLGSFGGAVSLSGDTAVIGALPFSGLGAAYVFVRSGTTWTQQQKLMSADGGANDDFAASVAVDGDRAFVGAPFDDTVAGLNAGSVSVFTRSGTTWTPLQILEASDGVQSNTFGWNLAASGDTLVVGAPLLNVSGGGSAYVFTRSGTQWTQQQKLRPSDGEPSDRFGAAVALSGDHLLIGAWSDNTAAGEDAGSAYVFLREGAQWQETQKLLAPASAAADEFGRSISASGGAALVGSPFDDTPNGQAAGSSHVFRLVTTTADLAIAQTDAPDPVGGLLPVTYTVAVNNAGPETAYLVSVSAAMPAGTTFVSASGAGWSCAQAAGAITCNRAALDVGPAPAISLVVRAPVGPGTITSVVSIVHSGVDPVVANDSSSENTVVTQANADLAVSKYDGQASSVPGETVSYTMVVNNKGPAPAIGATFTDVPPSSITNVAWTCYASAGSTCPVAAGSGPIQHTVTVAPGNAILIYNLTGTVSPGATGNLSNTASVAPPAGVADPVPGNNSSTDTNVLTPRADLALELSDAPDPVRAEAVLAYTIEVANVGPSSSSGLTLTDVLPPGVSFSSSGPGSPTCTHVSGTVTCTLGALAPAASHVVTIEVTANPATLGMVSNTASVTGNEPDPVGPNNSATEPTLVTRRVESELSHGTTLRADLASLGGAPDQDVYSIRQEAHASYEVVVDATSGDIGLAEGPALERLGADGTAVIQSSVPAGLGHSRSLRWIHTTGVEDGYVRVRSLSCESDCAADDVYRIRAWETTYRVPRFNNSGSQVTVFLAHNTGAEPVNGQIAFWSGSGALLYEQAFQLPPRALFVLNTASVPELLGASGSMTVSHDGPHGVLSGKAVAVEPATGFAFDSPLEPRIR